MTSGEIIKVAAPICAYQANHAEIKKAAGGPSQPACPFRWRGKLMRLRNLRRLALKEVAVPARESG
jgi:hypothetical protein